MRGSREYFPCKQTEYLWVQYTFEELDVIEIGVMGFID